MDTGAGASSQRPHGQGMKVRCCIVGGGPAGMMLGYLLGRAGIDVVVLEKHADFLRDFRGDTIHPKSGCSSLSPRSYEVVFQSLGASIRVHAAAIRRGGARS
jgi:2-polyprenyl-6-methoxyphenol hydroxylase-like FAD-dependent oxidoreductase